MGALDAFRASETHPNGKDFDAYLKAVHVPETATEATPMEAEVVGFGIAKMSDGDKPYVALKGKWYVEATHKVEQSTRVRALILSQRNGREMARSAKTEEELVGAMVFLYTIPVTFRGQEVRSVQLTVPDQSHP